MKIKNIVNKILSEQASILEHIMLLEQEEPKPLTRALKELLAKLTELWREDVPSLTDEQARKVFDKYRDVTTKLTDQNNPAVFSFLARNDGKNGSQKYTYDDLKNGKVGLKQLLMFLKEYNNFKMDIEGTDINTSAYDEKLNKIFDTQDQKPSEEKIEASKSLWYGEKNCVVNEDGFRVYTITNQKDSIRMGYYYMDVLKHFITINGYSSKTPWCVASRGDAQTEYSTNGRQLINSMTNMYVSYRTSNDYTFYFIIDEERLKFINNDGLFKYGMSALAVKPGERYVLTSMFNDGESNVTWNEVLRIYPKIAEHREKFVYRNYDPKESDASVKKTVLDTINEIDGSRDSFWTQTPDEKELYVSMGGRLNKEKSWLSMNNNLREIYISSTQEHDANSKFSTEEFFNAIIRSGKVWADKLDRRLKILGKSGIAFISDNFMKINYDTARIGKKNSNIKLFKHKQTGKYGIYNISAGSWLNMDGITYEAIFTRGNRTDVEDDINDKEFSVHEYYSAAGDKFYTITDDDDISSYQSYFLSEKKYNEIRNNFADDPGTLGQDQDIDLGETKKEL